MIYTGKHIDAQTALRYGLVNRVVPAEALMDEAKALMDDILNYIHSHYNEGSLNKMCHDFGYDPSYTSKLIKQFS